MKKSKLSITLVTSFIAAMALTACNEVTKSDKAIVNFTPYGSSESIELITDSMYNKYRGTSSGISMFYEKILEVLIRNQFQKGFDKGEMSYSEIKTWADNQVQEQKDKAKDNAKSNNTSYDDEWESILESHNVDDENGLKEHFIYDKEKEVITNWYAGDKDKAEDLKKEFIGIDATGAKVLSNVPAAMPYHIRHILVKVDEAADAQAKFYKGTITEAQAKLLADTASTLASSKYTFSQVAKMYSEDGSASNGGDVGIMTNDASSGSLTMVNEFQLGIYAYDNLYDATNAADPNAQNIKDGLGITTAVKDDLPNSFVEVPYEAFTKIGKYAKVTADKYGNKLANGSSTVYPRNILWNKYLNLHNVFLIAAKKSADFSDKFGKDTAKSEFGTLVGAADNTVPAKTEGHTGFKDGYLVDEHDNRIICVRSQYGIHFMVIEKSMYDYKDLATYYSTYVPGDKNYDPNAESYVNYIDSQSNEDYKKRADDLKSKITSFDSTYDYRLYQWLIDPAQGTINFTGDAAELKDDIKDYIETTQLNNANKQEEGLEKVWRTYNELLDVQEHNRSVSFKIVNSKGGEQSNVTRLVSETVAEDFMALYNGSTDATTYAKFAEGGLYYYYA